MRFTHQALHGLGDAQQNFEQLESLLPTSFLQLLSAQNLKLQVGNTGTLTIPGGWSNVGFALATAWPNTHQFCFALFNGGSALNNWSIQGSAPSGLGNAGIFVSNVGGAGTGTVTYFSLGN